MKCCGNRCCQDDCCQGTGCCTKRSDGPQVPCCGCCPPIDCENADGDCCCVRSCFGKTCCPCCKKKEKSTTGLEESCVVIEENCNSVDKGKPSSAILTEIPVEEDVVRTRGQQCAVCCKKFTAFLFSTIGLSCLLISYTIIGGLIFVELESEFEKSKKHNVVNQRHFHVQKLWNMTEEMNVFHKENWTILAEQILLDYEKIVYQATKRDGWGGNDEETELQWTFAGAMLYSITVVTTIGYGHIAPKTLWGRVVTIIYAILGIPLTLLTITNLGGFMATAFRFIYKNICCGLCCIFCAEEPTRPRVRSSAVRSRTNAANGGGDVAKSLTGKDPSAPKKKPPKKQFEVKVQWRSGLSRIMKTSDNKSVRVPIYVSLMVIASYIVIGAILFTIWEDDWDFLIGSYFCFITLTTIGFGDYVPGTSVDSWANQEKLVLCAMYLIIGLALIAMCFDLMQEEARKKFRTLGQKMGIIEKKT